jgi:hypothetical protein
MKKMKSYYCLAHFGWAYHASLFSFSGLAMISDALQKLTIRELVSSERLVRSITQESGL